MNAQSFEKADDFVAALPPSPFRQLAALLEGISPAEPVIDLSLGELKADVPEFALRQIKQACGEFGRYPPITAIPELDLAIRDYLARRFKIPAGEENLALLPLAGTREGLFSLPLALPRPKNRDFIAMPDPCYAAYPAAALAAGCAPLFLPAAQTGIPDFAALPESTAKKLRALFCCSPANPQGSALSLEDWIRLIKFSRAHTIPLIADEAYCDLYLTQAPIGLLEAAARLGEAEKTPAKDIYRGLIAFHSLSKRQAGAGLRSGFCAGDKNLLASYLRLRQTAGPQTPRPIQKAAAALWQDDTHPAKLRQGLVKKFALAEKLLRPKFHFSLPDGGFFLWLPCDDSLDAAKLLWREGGVKILPGGLLSYGAKANRAQSNHFIRIALVEEENLLEQAFVRIAALL